MYIDTHAHLNYKDRYGDIPALLRTIADAGVEKVIGVGWDLPSSALAAAMAERARMLYFAAGVHPSDIGGMRGGDLEHIAELLAAPKGVAVGEIGLDYHYEGSDPAAQQRAFAAQLELACALGLPVCIHSTARGRGDALLFGQRRNGARMPAIRAVHFLCGTRHL